MYTNFYVYMVSRLFMSGKLYWRIKKDGKWTWRPAELNPAGKQGIWTLVLDYVEEE